MTTPDNETAAPELADYHIAKRDCLALIASLGIKTTITGGGYAERREKPEDKPWAHFRWACEAERKGKIAHFDDYKTGVGHAVFQDLRPPMSEGFTVKERAKNGTFHLFTLPGTRAAAARYLKPSPPDAADILGSYARDFIDAHDAGCFEEWASNYGYDTDSRSAEERYQACLNSRKPLLALGLAHHQIAKLAELAGQF